MLLLHRNENPYGLSPSVRATVQSSSRGLYSYPGKDLIKLRRGLGYRFNLKPEQVLCGAGSTEVLRAALFSLARSGDARLFCSVPTHAPLAALGQWLLPLYACALDADLTVDLTTMRREVMAHQGAAIVYLSHPHAHTGGLLERDALLDWMAEAGPGVFFIVDEAYMEFVPHATSFSLAPFVSEFGDRLLVLRTFSKAFGLAGLRVGYGLTSRKRAQDFARYLSADAISVPAARTALDALEDSEWLEHANSLLAVSRRLLADGLAELRLATRMGPVNFILHALPGEPDGFAAHMAHYGVCVGYPLVGLPNWCRVTVGAPDEVAYYLAALRDVVALENKK